MNLSLYDLVQPAASRSKHRGSDRAYLVSVGVVAAVIIGLFFGVGFFLLAQTREQILGGAGPLDRGTELESLRSVDRQNLSSDAQSVPLEVESPPAAAVTSLPVLPVAQSPAAGEGLTPENTNPARGSAFPPTEAAVSPATGALSSAEAPAVRSAASEATRGLSAAVLPPEPASDPPLAAAPAMPSASPPIAADVAELLARGDSFVLIGDVASARVFYERAGNAGTSGRRCGWGRLSIRFFSGEPDSPRDSATQLRRALGTTAPLVPTLCKPSAGMAQTGNRRDVRD